MNTLNSYTIQPEQSTRIIATTHTDGTPCSYVDELTWDYNGMFSNSSGKTLHLNFGHVCVEHRLGIQHALHRISTGKNWSFFTISNYRSCLQDIAELIGSTNWEILNEDKKYSAFKDSLKCKNLSESSVLDIQATLNAMFDCGLTQRCVSTYENFSKNCSSYRKVKQNIALPENMMSKLLSKAIDIVECYHPFRHEISSVYDVFFSEYGRRKDNNLNICSMLSWADKNINHKIPGERFIINGHATGINEIQTACWLTLIGFSGIRTREGLMMNPKSYDDSRSYNGVIVPLIHGYITKNQPAGKPKSESWITHPIVKKALELAYDMSNYARIYYRKKLMLLPSSSLKARLLNETSSAFIRLCINKKNKRIIRCHIGDTIYPFAEKYSIRATNEDVPEFNALNPTRKGELTEGDFLPKLSNHDFRRSYAVFFMRNRFGNLMSLRAQFKHHNILMTEWYQNGASLAATLDLRLDEELYQMVLAANQEIYENTLFYIYNEAETLSGFEGDRIISSRRDYQDKYPGQIYMTMDEIRISIRNHTTSIVEHPTGFCFNPSCDRVCATDKSTQTCKHEVITPEKAREALPRHQRLVRKFRMLNTGRYYLKAILIDLKTHIHCIEKTFSEHNISFEPFTDQVKAPSIEDIL